MILAIVGPTGVGKTKLSVKLAQKYDAVIVNCDAVQVYRKLDIGSAKPTEEEKENVEHLLFDIKDVTEDYTVKDYQKDLREILDKYKDRNIVIVGGTGLYLCAGLFDYEFFEDEKKDFSKFTNEELYNMAKEKNPDMEIHMNNRIRLERYLTKTNESHNEDKQLYPCTFIGLTLPRDILYERINKRVDKMFEDGLLEEVKSLYNLKDKARVLSSAIGYKEVMDYLDGKITLDETKDLIKKNSRHYAKRQYTWFNNKMDVKWFDVNLNNFNETIDSVINYIESK